VDELFAEIQAAALQYRDEYLPDLEERRRERAARDAAAEEAQVARLRKDLARAKLEGSGVEVHPRPMGGDFS